MFKGRLEEHAGYENMCAREREGEKKEREIWVVVPHRHPMTKGR